MARAEQISPCLLGAPAAVPIDTWHGCYDGWWRGVIVPEAFAHPAKMSRALVARIFEDLFASGALWRGAVTVDPFGGIGTTAIEGTMRGVRVFCCELEPRFVGLGHQNFALHRDLWTAQGRTMPVLVQGNSRQLRAVLAPVMADAVVSSPPYATDVVGDRNGIDMSKTRIGSRQGGPRSQARAGGYGITDGQIGALAEGTVDAVVSSPPFASGDSASAQSISTRTDKSASWVKANCGSAATEGYGASDGQLGVMTLGSVADALVSSPPWEKGADGQLRAEKFKDPTAFAAGMSARDGQGTRNGTTPASRLAQIEREAGRTYGDAEGQIGNTSGNTFWFAARDIVAESFAILKPGGMAAWVVKAYVNKKQIVDFPGDWRRLCEHVGFEMVKEVRAMLVKEETRTDLISGEAITTRRERKSFFRRLAEKKGSPPIDYEVVLFMRKPVTVIRTAA